MVFEGVPAEEAGISAFIKITCLSKVGRLKYAKWRRTTNVQADIFRSCNRIITV